MKKGFIFLGFFMILVFIIKSQKFEMVSTEFPKLDANTLAITLYQTREKAGVLLQNENNSYFYLLKGKEEDFTLFLDQYAIHTPEYVTNRSILKEPLLIKTEYFSYYDWKFCFDPMDGDSSCDFVYFTKEREVTPSSKNQLFFQMFEPKEDPEILYRTILLKENYLVTLYLKEDSFDTDVTFFSYTNS